MDGSAGSREAGEQPDPALDEHLPRSLPTAEGLSLQQILCIYIYIYMYTYIHMCIDMCVYMYFYIYMIYVWTSSPTPLLTSICRGLSLQLTSPPLVSSDS